MPDKMTLESFVRMNHRECQLSWQNYMVGGTDDVAADIKWVPVWHVWEKSRRFRGCEVGEVG